jgi:hypothetical protein
MQTWEPRVVANGGNARPAALEVAQRLQRRLPEASGTRDASLACGDAGLAILYGYFDRCFPGAGWDKIAHQAILRATQTIAAGQPIGLFGGLSGLAYATWYLSHGETRYLRARAAIEDTLVPQAVAFAQTLATKSGMAVEEFDVVSGISGVAAYLLGRTSDDRARQALESILGAMVAILSRDEPAPKWHTPADLISARQMIGKFPDGNLNCGLAHGLPGMLSVLALASSQGVETPGQREALHRWAYWLKARHMPDQWGGSWPAAVSVGSTPAPVPAPAGWCYGNPGVARTLWLAGNALDDSCLRETALDAIRAVYQRPVSRRGISSPTFCHGVSGLLHITLRFANDTGLPDFADAADALLGQLLKSFAEDSVFGFRAYDSEARLVDSPALLDGAAGVALVLLAVTSDQDPSWDRIFLLS